ncbi:unnamed protein product [Rotaria magnacalcarata]|uniref:Steroid 5-alpha reductase C-terminal domain-containing protein n=1 Tax=Rotaria magnacalcarata TaxID=392030 RepID=A0A816NBM3_9BILA|nr:unnamed protein product [Rotaria magnacalcarata]
MDNTLSSAPAVVSTIDPDNPVKYKNYSLKDPIQYVTTRRALGNVLYSNPNLLCLNAGYVNRVGFRLFTKWEETVPLYLFIISGLMLKHNIAHRYAINPEKDATEWETISIPSHTLPKGYRQCLAIGMQDSSNTTQIYAAVPALYIGILVENIMKIKRYLGQILICGTYYAPIILASVLVMVWAGRLAIFLLIRVIKSGRKDTRLDDRRKIILLNSQAASVPSEGGENLTFGARDIAGIIMWSIGFICETVADFHKFAWRFSNPPKLQFMRYGLWRFSRAPNYFGEILVLWGIFVIVNSVVVSDIANENAKEALWAGIFSPIFTMVLLVLLSGLPLTQKPTRKNVFLMSNRPDANQCSIRDPDVKIAW